MLLTDCFQLEKQFVIFLLRFPPTYQIRIICTHNLECGHQQKTGAI